MTTGNEKAGAFFLFLGNVALDAATNRLKASGIRYQRKMLESKVENWKLIHHVLEDPYLKGVVVKLTSHVYRLVASPCYQSIARQIFANIGAVPHILFVHETILTGVGTDDAATPLEEDGEEYDSFPIRDYFTPPSVEVRVAVNQLLEEHHINIMPYTTNAEMSVLAAAFVEDYDRNLLFRIYVPSGRLYAVEADKLLTMFREWLTKVGRHNIRQDGYSTAAGQVYEFFGTDALHPQELSREFDEFSGFLTLCIEDISAATITLSRMGIDRRSAADLVARYGKEVRRLNLDLKQERESRTLAIYHSLESELLDATSAIPRAASNDIQRLINALIPDPSGLTPMRLLDAASPKEPAPSMVLNISPQFINVAENAVIQNVQGTVNLGPQAKELLNLVTRFGGINSTALQSDIHEVEDPDARPTDRLGARQRLKSFLLQLGGKIEDAAVAALFKYLEAKSGI